MKEHRIALFISMAAPFALAACNDPGAGGLQGSDIVDGTPQPVPTGIPGPGPIPDPGNSTAQIGASCHSSDPNQICLSLRYVVYADSAGKPVASESETLENLAQINAIWKSCGIQFEIGEYLAADPSDYGLNYNTSSSSELTRARNAFADDGKLLVVTTGAWTGSLGGAANAWTTMPGGGAYGVVMEEPVATYPNIIAHELGHYLNLDHAGTSSNVMSALIYDSSTALTSSQCSAARSAAAYYWKSMFR